MTARTVLLVLGTAGAVCLTGGAAFSTVDALAQQERVDVLDLGGPLQRLEVRTGGRVELRRGPLRGEATRTWSFREPQVAVLRSGGTTRVEARCAAPGPCEVDLVLTLPEQVDVEVDAAALRASALSGALSARVHHGDAEVLQHVGPLDLEVHDGDAVVGQLRGDLRVEGRGGDVRAVDLHADQVQVTTLGGGASLSFRTAPRDVGVEANGGDAELLLPQAQYRVQVQSLGGEERVEVDEADDAQRFVRVVARAGDAVVGRG